MWFGSVPCYLKAYWKIADFQNLSLRELSVLFVIVPISWYLSTFKILHWILAFLHFVSYSLYNSFEFSGIHVLVQD